MSFKKFSNENEKLTIKEKAVYNRKKWFILLAITATFSVLILSGLGYKPSGHGRGWIAGDVVDLND